MYLLCEENVEVGFPIGIAQECAPELSYDMKKCNCLPAESGVLCFDPSNPDHAAGNHSINTHSFYFNFWIFPKLINRFDTNKISGQFKAFT